MMCPKRWNNWASPWTFIEPSTAALERTLEVRRDRGRHPRLQQQQGHEGNCTRCCCNTWSNGGTLVVQYNTTPRFFSGDSDGPDRSLHARPIPFQTFPRPRDRGGSASHLPDPKGPCAAEHTEQDHHLSDFEGWVQERGLYFASELRPELHPADRVERSRRRRAGRRADHVAEYGKGRYVYTGISFFRQLPAGVPGAYRLFANLISLRSDK
jgi:hypothetical protein